MAIGSGMKAGRNEGRKQCVRRLSLAHQTRSLSSLSLLMMMTMMMSAA